MILGHLDYCFWNDCLSLPSENSMEQYCHHSATGNAHEHICLVQEVQVKWGGLILKIQLASMWLWLTAGHVMFSFLRSCIYSVLLQILINSFFFCCSVAHRPVFKFLVVGSAKILLLFLTVPQFQALWIRKPPAIFLCLYLSLDLVL